MDVYRSSVRLTLLLYALCTAADGGRVPRPPPTETTTTHIKGVPLAGYDYQPLSYGSTSPPSVLQSLRRHGEEEKKKRIQADQKLISHSSCLSFVSLHTPICIHILGIFFFMYPIYMDARIISLCEPSRPFSIISIIPSDPPTSHQSWLAQFPVGLFKQSRLKMLGQCDKLVQASCVQGRAL